MFKKIFDKTYDKYVFTKYDLKPVVEDFYKIKNNIFCVADGVTRDLLTGEATPYPTSKEQAEYIIRNYPNPSGAFDAAKICATKFVEYVSNLKENEISKETIFEAIKKANDNIWEINRNRSIDYLVNDMFCCMAVGGIIQNNKLFCFSIGDSHITILDKELNVLFTTIDNHTECVEYLEEVVYKNNELNWNSTKDRAKERREYRNKPDMNYYGKKVSFGALSGEKEAMQYVDTYEVDLKKAKYICAYSDGCEDNFKEKIQIKETIKDPLKIQFLGNEKTLIIYENDNI